MKNKEDRFKNILDIFPCRDDFKKFYFEIFTDSEKRNTYSDDKKVLLSGKAIYYDNLWRIFS